MACGLAVSAGSGRNKLLSINSSFPMADPPNKDDRLKKAFPKEECLFYFAFDKIPISIYIWVNFLDEDYLKS
jgi:hypothetical protein